MNEGLFFAAAWGGVIVIISVIAWVLWRDRRDIFNDNDNQGC